MLLGVLTGALMVAQGTNGVALDYPAYEQEVMATFATPEEASAATCAIAPLPDDARVVCSCRWDDTNPKHLSKAEMMTRVGVKGSFYFVGRPNPFFADGARKLMALGHAIGNHTLSHGQMMTLGLNEGFRQIAANRILLETTIQHTVNSYVSPFGWSTDPLDAGHAKKLAEALVASGHFVSEDAQMSWSGLPATTWMWTNRFSSNDRDPQRKLFEEGFARSLAAAFRNPDVPRVTLGTHSWCDAAGEARQEEWLREFFLRDDAVQMNDWEYGAYRYQYLNGGVRKERTAGTKATFRVRRFAAAHVGDAIPLSLRFSVRPQAVVCGTKPLARQPRGTWALAQDELHAKMPRIARAEDGVLEVEPDEQAATITVRFGNRTGKTLCDLFVAAALPPKWSVRRVCAACGELKPGACFERTFSMGRIGRNDYAYGTAYYPVSLDFVCDGQPHRLWADRTTERITIPDDAPVKAVRIWGPGKASVLAAVDWTQVSHPGSELPDAAAWMRPVSSEDALATIVAPPISIRPGRNGDAAVREVLRGDDHARYVVYDFTAGSDGIRSFRCNADPKYRSPVLYLNGKRVPYAGDGQVISVKKGRNRLILRADACAGQSYTKPLYMDVSCDVTRILSLSGSGWTADGVPVTVPHCWNAVDGADGPGAERKAHKDRRTSLELLEGYSRKAVSYRRVLPNPTKGMRQFVKVDAAATVATVKVNGQTVGVHKGAFTAFCYEITKFLKPKGNELEIVVDNRRDVDVAPISGDYTMMGGLYRKVWFVETPQVCIDRTIDGGPGVELDVRMDGHVTAKVHVLGGPDETRELYFPNPVLWSPENPKLYEARIELSSGDAVTIPFGFRTTEFRDDGFYLNGVKRKLRGVCRHQEVGGKGWATTVEDEKADLALIREMGADAVRTAHYPQSESFYSLLDRAGLVAWCEVPLLNGVTHSAAFLENLKAQYREMVAQLKHHPSICMWSIFNELYENFPMPEESAEPLVEEFAAWAKPIDPTRPQVAASDQVLRTRLNRIPADALAFNRYPGWYNGPIEGTRAIFDEMFAINATRRTFGISEYGGGGSIVQHGDPLTPCKENTIHTEEYQAYLHSRYYAEIAKEPRLWGTFLWVMFDFASDYRTEGDHPGINDKGMVCHDHKTKKDVFYFYQANWTKTPTLHLVGRRMKSSGGDKLNLLAFSNVGTVTLKVNGVLVGTKEPDDVATVLFKDVPLTKGANRILMTSGGLSDSCEIISEPQP